ncbi:MAG: glycosyltransferase family 2 protein [Roseiarcus sp.]|jgi:hypothetical protein
MAEVTIGVPVYNGADLLDQSLACLARQTFGDFKVLIFDNASTDATPDIAKAWAARDARFHYTLQPRNVGAVANFRDVLLAADTPWFLWRADDDLSDDNYVEVLYRLATHSPGCELAISSVVNCDVDGSRERLWRPPTIVDPSSTRGRLRLSLNCHPAAFYGLWRREAIIRAFLPVSQRFPFAFASDHLTFYGPIIAGAVRATDQTRLIARTRRAPGPRTRVRTPFATMVEVRQAFRHELRRIRAERQPAPALRVALTLSEPIYLKRTLPSLLKMARTGLRELLGIAGPRVVKRHFERNV